MTIKTAPQQIREAILSRQRFVLSSHARPDGDSIGSQLAMVYALRALGKEAVAVNADPAPAPLMQFPGVPDIRKLVHEDVDYQKLAKQFFCDLLEIEATHVIRLEYVRIDL
jgi:phosphoesterase RecJ-like protein